MASSESSAAGSHSSGLLLFSLEKHLGSYHKLDHLDIGPRAPSGKPCIGIVPSAKVRGGALLQSSVLRKEQAERHAASSQASEWREIVKQAYPKRGLLQLSHLFLSRSADGDASGIFV